MASCRPLSIATEPEVIGLGQLEGLWPLEQTVTNSVMVARLQRTKLENLNLSDDDDSDESEAPVVHRPKMRVPLRKSAVKPK